MICYFPFLNKDSNVAMLRPYSHKNQARILSVSLEVIQIKEELKVIAANVIDIPEVIHYIIIILFFE